MLTACAGSTHFDKPVQIDAKPVVQLAEKKAQPDPSLVADCADPVDIPDGALSGGAAERLWGQDRAALRECKAKHSGLDAFYRKRDADLADQPIP